MGFGFVPLFLMKLTLQTDYALRLLIYLGTIDEERWVSVSEVAKAYEISASHLTKTAQNLAKLGYIATKTGPKGGLRLIAPASEIGIGEVVRQIEPELAPVPCLAETSGAGSCAIERACALKPVLARARDAFVGVLDEYTLQDCLGRPEALVRLFGISLKKDR